MKTTVVIDDDLLREALEVTKVKTKREAIELGLRELVRKKNRESLIAELGTYDMDMSVEELERLRNEP